eukprot:TRINITY_DN7608_c0_g1_i1.p1 TRINITY_DN7608_c0_g1~~TRINITY_DN7608_c0_g1_i1.p1  ORF type:complete len:516 (+),score=49.56 TRINITY_DN7608_c0_g1_i1:137-1684(+)
MWVQCLCSLPFLGSATLYLVWTAATHRIFDTHFFRLCVVDPSMLIGLVILFTLPFAAVFAVGFGLRTFVLTFGFAPLFLGIVALVVFSVLKKRASGKPLPEVSESVCGKFVRLTQVEEGMLDIGGGSVKTLFEGECPEEFLVQRSEEAVRLNPWLNSVLKTDPARGKPAMWVPDDTKGSDFLQVINVDDETKLHGNHGCIAGLGKDILDKPNERLFKVTLLKYQAARKFSIVVSANHMVADAHTLYSIWGLFKPDLPVKRYDVQRNLAWKKGRLSGLGSKARLGLMWYLFIADDGPFRRMFAKTKPTVLKLNELFVIDRAIRSSWVDSERAKHVPTFDAPLLSTNDLITSWFGRVTDCDALAMVVDMRGKVPELTNDMMGNYGELCTFFRREFCEPANIRRAVKSLGEVALPKGEIEYPGKGRKVSMITDWRSRYVDVQFSNCKFLMHGVSGDGADHSEGITLQHCPLAIAYHSSKDESRIIVLSGKPIHDLSPLDEQPGPMESDVKSLRDKILH